MEAYKEVLLEVQQQLAQVEEAEAGGYLVEEAEVLDHMIMETIQQALLLNFLSWAAAHRRAAAAARAVKGTLTPQEMEAVGG